MNSMDSIVWYEYGMNSTGCSVSMNKHRRGGLRKRDPHPILGIKKKILVDKKAWFRIILGK
jgi:hypothetical protein